MKKLLIANRGEIVNRIISTCEKMNIQTVVVYSEADRNMPYVERADEAILIGPANPVESYLNIDVLVKAVKDTGCDAVHPGYGFLSERGAFAEAMESVGATWVGPSAKLLRAISSKCYCRSLAQRVGVPVIPGTITPVQAPVEIEGCGNEYGWPLYLKLDKGGGGKGIERIDDGSMAGEILERATRIGAMAFGSGDCYIEGVVDRPRHIEIQFIADSHGNCICLGERECSIQRRHQKIIEEATSPVVTEQERRQLYEYVRRIIKEMSYVGAGTIENLRDTEGNYYFMEINARLQVEHPVTEFLTGIDIVEQQLRIADGEKLDMTQEQIKLNGHAVEARVYAEDPDTFIPSPGEITALSLPETDETIRIDHAMKAGGTVPPYYDPMLAKVVAWGANRLESIGRLKSTLEQIHIEGVKSSIPTCLKILSHPGFIDGEFDTSFFDRL